MSQTHCEINKMKVCRATVLGIQSFDVTNMARNQQHERLSRDSSRRSSIRCSKHIVRSTESTSVVQQF
eukprot:1272587-Alexandrium_andersonii.AAC.1